jgi:hypothetical protein
MKPIYLCTLFDALGKKGLKGVTREAYQGKCGHIACPACAADFAYRFLITHSRKAAVVDEPIFRSFLLTWQNLPIHGTSANEVVRFCLAGKQLCSALDASQFGEVLGWLVFSEYNPTPGRGLVQPHVHLFVITTANATAFRQKLGAWWLGRGGERLPPPKRESRLTNAVSPSGSDPLAAFEGEWTLQDAAEYGGESESTSARSMSAAAN